MVLLMVFQIKIVLEVPYEPDSASCSCLIEVLGLTRASQTERYLQKCQRGGPQLRTTGSLTNTTEKNIEMCQIETKAVIQENKEYTSKGDNAGCLDGEIHLKGHGLFF